MTLDSELNKQIELVHVMLDEGHYIFCPKPHENFNPIFIPLGEPIIVQGPEGNEKYIDFFKKNLCDYLHSASAISQINAIPGDKIYLGFLDSYDFSVKIAFLHPQISSRISILREETSRALQIRTDVKLTACQFFHLKE